MTIFHPSLTIPINVDIACKEKQEMRHNYLPLATHLCFFFYVVVFFLTTVMFSLICEH